MSDVVTKEIPGVPGYLATSEGEVIGVKGKPLKPFPSNSRPKHVPTMVHVFIVVEGVRVRKAFHIYRLIALAFLGEPPTPRHEVHHINFNAMDHRPENLMWVARRDHAHLHAQRVYEQEADDDEPGN